VAIYDGNMSGTSFARTLRKSWSYHVRVQSKRREFRLARLVGTRPVVTCGTWRTSSTAIHGAIKASGAWPCVKAHSIGNGAEFLAYCSCFRSPEALVRRHAGDTVVRSEIIDQGIEAAWVVLVRDPLSVAVSLVAMERHRHCAEIASRWGASCSAGFGALGRQLDALLVQAPVELLDRWFDLDVRPALGWTPLDEPFDQAQGWSVSRCRYGPVLTLRADLADAVKGDVLSDFLGRRIKIANINSARSHGCAGLVGALAERISCHEELLARASAQRTGRHFWTPSELERLRECWIPGLTRR
jgi:hypothetical protein